MKAVLDTMLWVSFAVNPAGFRACLIRAATRKRVRLYVSQHILDELVETLIEDLGRTRRFAFLAQRAVLRRARLVKRTGRPRRYVPGDPDDDPIVATALIAKSHCLVTADKEILKVGKVQSVEMLAPAEFARQIGMELTS